MSQGRISYSRVVFVGALLLAISGSGFAIGRLTDDGVRSSLRMVPKKEARQERPVPNDMTLALRNLVTIVTHPGTAPEREEPHSTVAKTDLILPGANQAGLRLALRNAITILPPLVKKPPVSTQIKSDFMFVDTQIARQQLALGNALTIIPSMKNHERVAVVEKSEVSAGVFDARSDGEPNGGISSTFLSQGVRHSAVPFRSPSRSLWSKFGQPVWYVRPDDTGLRIEQTGKPENASATSFFGGLTEREFRTREVRCLAKAIYHEARGESQKGQFAVAQTIMNRVRAKFFPDTICGVIYENAQRKNKCQFSFACDGISDKPKDLKLWDVALDNARQVASGKVWLDEIGYASHYHATYVRPKWRKYMNRITRIGIHIFYRAKFLPLPEELALRMPKKDRNAN